MEQWKSSSMEFSAIFNQSELYVVCDYSYILIECGWWCVSVESLRKMLWSSTLTFGMDIVAVDDDDDV